MPARKSDREKAIERTRAARERTREIRNKAVEVGGKLERLLTRLEAAGEEDWREVLEIGEQAEGLAVRNQIDRGIRATGYRDDERRVAWLRNNIGLLFKTLGADRGHCSAKGCRAPVWWVPTKGGKKAPITDDALNHFADCEAADRFRRAKS